MIRLSRILMLLMVPLLFSGCAATFTNLTPQQQVRTTNAMYAVEFALQSRDQAMKWDTVTPFAVIGDQFYPMYRVDLVPNRWEGFIPVSANTNLVHYRFKADWEFYNWGQKQPNSAMSPTYRLKILDN